ncbi:MAG: toll/interleukin-1 receptor domain-containing protein [Clostridia bacterium]|nr:toll/interleukin-1 receptor domain-containing protein [Clostridia bacterium]
MGIFDKLKKENTGYIFLSHSHADIEEVRKIRNKLEEDGFEPLCFYLKCLSEDGEIEELIKREIDAREWFVFVNSENSRKSKWVNMEREYITSSNKKKILTVDLDNPKSISEVINKISQKLRVYIAYSHKDYAIHKHIKNKLIEKDFLVFSDEGIEIGFGWGEEIANAIVQASAEGCVIALITENSVKSLNFRDELRLAFDLDGRIIPIYVGNPELSPAMNLMLNKRQCYRLPNNPTDEDISKVVERISSNIILS